MPQSVSPATLFAFLEVASVPVLQHKVIIYLNTAYWHTYPVFQQSEACGAFVGLKTSTMEASADKKARKSTSESEVEGGILGDFMGFKMNCESVFLFSFHPSLTSSPSSPGFYYCLSTSSAPPSTCLLSCSLLKLPRFSAPSLSLPPTPCLALLPSNTSSADRRSEEVLVAPKHKH